MSQVPPNEMEQHLPGYEAGNRVGVIEALQMAWQLLKDDLARLWLLGFVLVAINMGLGLVNSIPYLGSCTSLATAIFVQPALTAGLFYALMRRVDLGRTEVGELFGGFQYRYWPAVLANLILMGFALGAMIALGIILGGFSLVVGLATNAFEGNEPRLAMLLCIGVCGFVAFVVLILFGMHFVFTFVAIWDYPQSAWEAVKTSVLTVWHNLLSMVGLTVIMLLIGLAVMVPPAIFFFMTVAGMSDGGGDVMALVGIGGIVICGLVYVGVVGPLMAVWYNTTLIYLYRSWTGQALEQPLAEGPAGEAPANAPPPLPGGSGSPFPPRDTSRPVPPDLVGGEDTGSAPPADDQPPG